MKLKLTYDALECISIKVLNSFFGIPKTVVSTAVRTNCGSDQFWVFSRG